MSNGAYDTLAATAGADAIAAAKEWYIKANELANELANESGYSVEQCSSVISAFSPRCPWSRNVKLAREFIRGNKVGALPVSIRNAERALSMGFDALNGLKTNNFARNIAGDLDAVTIDIWMIRAAGIEKKSVNKTEYRQLSSEVKELAPKYNLMPAELQALIWIAIRGKAE